MDTTQVVETSVTINNNSPIQDYVHPENNTQPTYEIIAQLFLVPVLRSPLGTPGTMTPHFYLKHEQKCENALQIMSLAAYASETNKLEISWFSWFSLLTLSLRFPVEVTILRWVFLFLFGGLGVFVPEMLSYLWYLCYAGQATLHMDLIQFSLSSSTMSLQSLQQIQIFHCSGGDEVKIWCV